MAGEEEKKAQETAGQETAGQEDQPKKPLGQSTRAQVEFDVLSELKPADYDLARTKPLYLKKLVDEKMELLAKGGGEDKGGGDNKGGGEAATGDPSKDGKKKKRRGGYQRQAERLASENEDLKRQLKEAQKGGDKPSGEQTGSGETVEPKGSGETEPKKDALPDKPVKPKLEDFDDEMDFVKASNDYVEAMDAYRDAVRENENKATQHQEGQNKLIQDLQDQGAVARKNHEDFDQSVATVADLQWSDGQLAAMAATGHAGEIMYALSKDQELAEALVKVRHSFHFGVQLGAIQGQLGLKPGIPAEASQAPADPKGGGDNKGGREAATGDPKPPPKEPPPPPMDQGVSTGGGPFPKKDREYYFNLPAAEYEEARAKGLVR